MTLKSKTLKRSVWDYISKKDLNNNYDATNLNIDLRDELLFKVIHD